MGKAQKRKRGQLTEEEIWDDSALLQSWQDAVDEYEFYHSIHAKGENVDEVLRQAEIDEAAEPDRVNPRRGGVEAMSGGDLEDGEISEENGGGSETVEKAGHATNFRTRNEQIHDPETRGANIQDGADRREILENMKMAYWWAGYYSGLYDSQPATAQGQDSGGSNIQKAPK